MRKVKHYIGQRRGKHHFGLITDRPGLWAIPRLLRKEFCRAYWEDAATRGITPAISCFPTLEELCKIPAESDPYPPVIPFVRYSDFDLPRNPKTEVIYQAAVAGLISKG